MARLNYYYENNSGWECTVTDNKGRSGVGYGGSKQEAAAEAHDDYKANRGLTAGQVLLAGASVAGIALAVYCMSNKEE